MLYRFYAFTLLWFYTFKTLRFYFKLPACKPDFFSCLNTFFTSCTKTVRQIKRLIYPPWEVWQCLAFEGSVCPGITLQYSLKEVFTL